VVESRWLSAAVCNATSFKEYRESCDVLCVAGVLLLKYLDQLGASLKCLFSYALVLFTFPILKLLEHNNLSRNG
jgi:hypothetical protein